MLILTRIPGKWIFIGDDIKIGILGINGNQVRIGIEAPDDVAVHREEVHTRILQERIFNINMGSDNYIQDEQEELLGWQKNE